MSLLMLKTKNLSWQDHTLNIEAMLAPLRSTLLMNKHKTLDTKFDQEKALYQRQRDACLKDFVVEKRLIERRRQKILRRKKELLQEIRSQSALEHVHDGKSKPTPSENKERSLSAPSNGRGRREKEEDDGEDGVSNIVSSLPRLSLRHTPLFGGTPLRPRLFLETGTTAAPSESDCQSVAGKQQQRKSVTSSPQFFITGESQPVSSRTNKSSVSISKPSKTTVTRKAPKKTAGSALSKPPLPPPPPPNFTKPGKETPTTERSTARGLSKRLPNVTFLGLLDDSDENDNGDDERIKHVVVEVKQKTLEDKVRDFLKELDAFNSRPPTACSEDIDETQSVFSSVRSRDVCKIPLAANKYQTLTLDKKLLEKAFDRYIERKSHEDLLKAMKLAAKMKAHIRQARNTSLVPTMATMKSSRTFLKLLKRQQRREKQGQPLEVS